MPNQVTIKPSNHVFTVQGDETILDAALREGFVISYGCRNGACGTCKGRLLEGEVDYGTYQETALPEAEKRLGMALFCQARPRGDIVIECREIGAAKDIPIRTLPCRVQKMQRVAADIMVLHLKLPASERLQFLAGQYIDILLKDGTRRSFLDGERAARRRIPATAPAQLRRAVFRAGVHQNEGSATSCASKARSALFSCARTATSRSSCSRAAPASRRSRRSSNTRSIPAARGRWCCTGERACAPIST